MNFVKFRCWIAKQLSFFDKHPWDWVAHFILGLIVFLIEWIILRKFLSPVAEILSIWGTVNALLFIELTQIDVFGLSFRRLGDTIIDLICGGLGLILGIYLIMIF